MGFFDTEENIEQYLKMAEGYDGKELIKVLKTYLKRGSSVLELGMGPGKDLDILRRTYKAAGSDNAQLFLDRYKKKHAQADLLLLDAVTMETKRKFDCIYSNKVLQHLTKRKLKSSITNQMKVLKKKGLLFHSLWYGTGEEHYEGLTFLYHTANSFVSVLPEGLELLEWKRYKEFKADDSFYAILRKK